VISRTYFYQIDLTKSNGFICGTMTIKSFFDKADIVYSEAMKSAKKITGEDDRNIKIVTINRI